MKTLRIVPVLVLALAGVACGGGGDEGADPMTSDGANAAGGVGGAGGKSVTLGPDGLPVGPDGKPLEPKLDGRYELSNYFDLTSTGILPDPASETLQALSNFKEHPTQTLVDLLDVAHVPVVPQVLNAIPSFIRDQVLGFIDDHVVKSLYKGVPFAKTLTSMLDDLATITTQFELVTTLDLPAGDALGNAKATHTFSGVAYTWQDKRTFIGAPQVLKTLEAQPVAANAVALEKRSPALESGRLTLGDHQFTVPLGSFTLLAADQLVKDKLGAADLRAAIGMVVDCEAVAQDVSTRCIDPIGPGKICVDHKTELKSLCETGLDALVATLRSNIQRLDLPALHLRNGEARMWDAATDQGPLDAVVDRLDSGFWAATVGAQEKNILATFVGHRVP